MCFEDFLRVYNKLFICINFPPNYIGFRAHGKWIVGSESGGLPIRGTPEEMKSFLKNPQYYLQINDYEGKHVYMSLLQDDGRLVDKKFPFPNAVRKVCLVICRVNGKGPVENCGQIMDKTAISQRRDLSMDIHLDKGHYVVMPCTLNSTDGGNYCLEIFLEDTCPNETVGRTRDPPEFDKTVFEKIGGLDCEYEIVTEGRPSQLQKVEQDKIDFMMAQFQKCIGSEDEAEYGEEMNEEQKENARFDEY